MCSKCFAAIPEYDTISPISSSEIIYDIDSYADINFTSIWSAPEPLGLENWIDHAADGFAGGYGTREDPFLISTAEQLAYLAKLVNEGSFDERINVEILNDIDLAGREWTPIGTKQHHFIGTFNGGNNVISNLTIATPQDGQGLFGFAARSSLRNLTLADVNIKGRDFVGGLAGAITGSAIGHVNLAGTVDGRYYVGGFSGYGFMNWIRRVTYLGNVKGDAYVGGIVGEFTTFDRLRVFVNTPWFVWPTPEGDVIGHRKSDSFMVYYSVTASVSGIKYVGGVIGYNSGNGIAISDGIFTGSIKGKAFSDGVSGFPPVLTGRNIVLLYVMGNDSRFTEITYVIPHEVRFWGFTWEGMIGISYNTVIRQKNDNWYLNSNPLPTEDVENNFLRSVRLEGGFANYLSEYITEKQHISFRMLHVPYGITIPQDDPLSIDISEKNFLPVLRSFANGEFWIEDNFFKMSGAICGLPKGVYAIPCFRNVNGSFETIWVLLNVK